MDSKSVLYSDSTQLIVLLSLMHDAPAVLSISTVLPESPLIFVHVLVAKMKHPGVVKLNVPSALDHRFQSCLMYSMIYDPIPYYLWFEGVPIPGNISEL